MIFGSLI